MEDKSCRTCFYHLSIADVSDSCICVKDGGLGNFIEVISCCEYYENKNKHVYTLEEVSRMLLEFCSDLTDEIIFCNTMNQVPTEENYMSFCKRYRKLADMLKEHGVVL